MPEFGGVGKKFNVNTVVRFTAWDIRRIFQDIHMARVSDKHYVDDIEKKHALLAADEEYKKFLKWLVKAKGYGYKIGLRELILLKGMLINLRVFLESERKVDEESSRYLKEIKKIGSAKRTAGGFDVEPLLKYFEKLELEKGKESRKFKEEIADALKLAEQDLTDLRQSLHNLEKSTELDQNSIAQEQVKFLLKTENVSRWRLFPLRFRTRRQRSNLKHLDKDEQTARMHDLLFRNHLNNTLKMLEGKIPPEKMKKEEQKIIEELKKEDKTDQKTREDMIESMKRFIGNMYRVVTYDMLLMRALINLARSNFTKNKVFLEKNYTPQVFGMEKMQQVKQEMGNLEKHLDNMETFVKQIWGYAESDLGIAKAG